MKFSVAIGSSWAVGSSRISNSGSIASTDARERPRASQPAGVHVLESKESADAEGTAADAFA